MLIIIVMIVIMINLLVSEGDKRAQKVYKIRHTEGIR